MENNIEIHAGHGLDYKTTKLLSKISYIKEYNIGHFIIGESIKIGISKVIKNFKKIIKKKMKIFGNGVDIVENNRFKKLKKKNFINRIFSQKEIDI